MPELDDRSKGLRIQVEQAMGVASVGLGRTIRQLLCAIERSHDRRRSAPPSPLRSV